MAGSWLDEAEPLKKGQPAKSTQPTGHWTDDAEPVDDRSIGDKVVEDSTLGNMIAGFTKGPSLGEYIPVVGPAMKGVGQMVGAGMESATSGKSYDDSLIGIKKQDEDERDKYEKEYPAAANAKSFVGASVLPLGKIAEGVVPVASKGVGMASPQFMNWLGGAAKGAINTGEAAAVAGADQMARGHSEQALPAAGEAAKYAGGFSAALSGLHGGGLAYSRFMAGLRPETISRYLTRGKQINDLQEPILVDEASNAINHVKSKGEEGVRQANEEFKLANSANKGQQDLEIRNARDKAKQGRSSVENNYNTRVLDEKGATEAAKNEALTHSMNRNMANQDQASQLERQGAEDISSMMMGARQKIGASSKEALNKLDEHEGKIPLAWYKGKLTQGINREKFGETALPNEGVGMMQKYKGILDSAKVKKVSASELKKLIKQLDDDLSNEYSKSQMGGHNTPAIRTLMGMRSRLAKKLELQVPGYAEAMVPLREQTRASKAMQKEFPNPEADKILGKVKGIDGTNKIDLRKKISTAEEKFGGQGLSKLDEANRLRGIDETGGQTFEAPNQQFLDYLKNKKSRGIQAYEKNYKASEESSKASRLEREKDLQHIRDEDASPYKTLIEKTKNMGEDNVQSKLRRLGGDPDNEIVMRRKLDEIGRLTGKGDNYFSEQAKDLGVKRAMEGSFTRGSRNVNLASYSMKGLAEALGLSSEKSGMLGSFGAILGGVTDVVGPKAVKAAIDMGKSGSGRMARAALKRAALAGPQAYANTHARLLRDDPEYKAAYEAASE